MQNTSEITSYTYFILANNTLSGDLPSFLGQPLPYTVVDLSGNNFSNECDASFLDLGLCANPPSPSPGAVPDSPPAGPAAEGQGDSSSGGGGGLSKGATAAIVIVVLLVVGVLGFVGYRYWRRRQQGVGGGGFQRFEDNGSLEMGRTNNNGIYNPQLAP